MSRALEAEYRRFVREHDVATLFNDHPREPPAQLDLDQAGHSDLIEEEIRRLEAARRYISFADVGTEPRMDWLFRLGTVAARKGPYQGPLTRSLRQVLRNREVDVRRGLERLGRPWPAVHVDLFPTGDLNAMSVPVPHGHLVLVNTGLMNLVFNLLKIHVLSQRIGPSNDDRALLSEHQVGLLLAEALNAYIYGAGSWMTWSTPHLDQRRADLISPTVDVCEDFVLAHEIGHVLAGDREAPAYMSAPEAAPVPGLRIPVADHEAELRADRVGAEIVLAAFGVDAAITASDERCLWAGLSFFFLADFAVRSLKDQTADDEQYGAVNSHPPPRERLRRLVEAFPPHHDSSLTLMDSFSAWFEHYLPAAATHIDEVNATIVRRDAPWWRPQQDAPTRT